MKIDFFLSCSKNWNFDMSDIIFPEKKKRKLYLKENFFFFYILISYLVLYCICISNVLP